MINRSTRDNKIRWQWSLCGYGDAVGGEERTRKGALEIARRCKQSNLKYYFSHVHKGYPLPQRG